MWKDCRPWPLTFPPRTRARVSRCSTCTSAARWRPYPRPTSAPRTSFSLAYTPGVAEVCEAIAADPELTRHLHLGAEHGRRSSPTAPRSSAWATSAPAAALPVMEGKAALFKSVRRTSTPSRSGTERPPTWTRSSRRWSACAPSFGGVNLEDISAPRCFETRGAPHGGPRHARSSTTTSTAPPSSRWPRSPTPLKLTRPRAGRARPAWSSPAPAPPASRSPKILLAAGIKDIVGAPTRKGVVNARTVPTLWQTPAEVKARMAELHQPTCAVGAGSLGRAPSTGADVYVGVSGGTRSRGALVATMADRRRSSSHMANPRPGGPPRRSPTSTPGRRGDRPLATSRTRSTTCWPSPASSGAHFDVHGPLASRAP